MREAQGDLWTWDDGEVVARVITTNGFVKADGTAVLGRGVAQQAVQRLGDPLRAKVGERLLQYGNHVHAFKPNPAAGRPYWLLTFPVKPERGPSGNPGWECPADPALIERSAGELLSFYLGMLETGTVVMPRPGCGNGGLWWNDVREPLARVLNQPVRLNTELEPVSFGDVFVVVHP